MGRGERGAAGGVHHAVRAAQVQAVGDAAGHHVAEEPREGVFLPVHVGVGDALDHGVRHGPFDAGFRERAAPKGMPQARAQRHDGLERPGDAQNDADLAAVEGALRAVAGVPHGGLGGDEAQELGGVGGGDVVGGDAELGGVEVHRREEAAAAAVGAVGRFWVGVVELV
ncbi:MAG: hypothetical protein FD126_1529 [Elusimicrobia bacterium]|nr:MAG: hypothetical protein FD126_1529 [Elusimicrobiota bacterium]